MKSHDPEHLHARIDRKLAALARRMPSPPEWHESWSCLDSKATPNDRFGVCQLIRASGMLPQDASYFLISWAVEQMAEREMDRERPALEIINLLEACRTSERVFVQFLQQNGENEMADLFMTDRQVHERRREAGRLFFFDAAEPDAPPDPHWLETLLRLVADSVVVNHPPAKFEHRLTNESGLWQLHVLLAADQPWAIDVEPFQDGFAQIDRLGWYGAPPGPDDNPYFWIEGEYLDRQIFLRISGRRA